MNHSRLPIVALVGRPNVGKSSLFNRLVKNKKAIVDPTPGVTRDRQYEQVAHEGHLFVLVDTGGIETVQDGRISGLIKDQSLQAVKEADVVLFVMDGKEGVMPEDHEVVNILRRTEKKVCYLINKVDGYEVEQLLLPPFYELGIEKLWPVSAAHGYGVRDFLDYLVGELPTVSDQHSELPENTISFACIGRPNVGKSSLINRLLGEDRMVVSDLPGTTRDSVDTLLTRSGRNYLLIDTAGIRRKGKVQEKLEKFSVLQALGSLERCDIALVLIDASEGITEQDTKIIGYGLDRGRACVIIVNKWDLIGNDKRKQKFILEEVERATNFIGYAPVLTVSALTGSGVKKILPALQAVSAQFRQKFTTGQLNRVLQDAVAAHTPPAHKGRRLKLYYTTQLQSEPPTFLVFANYPDDVHFSYYRFLVNQFRKGLNLDKTPIKLILRERKRKKYG